jgi:hypothetical protein
MFNTLYGVGAIVNRWPSTSGVVTSRSVKEALNFRVAFNGSGSITAGGALNFRCQLPPVGQ